MFEESINVNDLFNSEFISSSIFEYAAGKIDKIMKKKNWKSRE